LFNFRVTNRKGKTSATLRGVDDLSEGFFSTTRAAFAWLGLG